MSNKKITKEEKYKSVAIKLINEWVQDSLTIMYEYSGNFEQSKKVIREGLLNWLKEIDAVDLYDGFINKFEDLREDI